MSIRIGFGIDFHQLAEGRAFWLGGVQIPASRGAVGHSDADVLLHAVCDALLGALALGDIGQPGLTEWTRAERRVRARRAVAKQA